MKKRVTIKDIAKKADVSISTVHFALNNKPGVSEATRARIKKIAAECGYRPNLIASSLKRQTIRVAAAFPIPTEDNRFYFTRIWEGVRKYMQKMSDFNVELCEIKYYDDPKTQADRINNLLEKNKIDGLLTVGHMVNYGAMSIKKFIKKEIPVVLINTDLPESNRLCCIQPDYKIIGRTLAELVTDQISAQQKILLCAGDKKIPAHYLITQGFDSYIAEKDLQTPVLKVYDTEQKEVLYQEILSKIASSDVAACCSVSARNSVLLGKAIIATKRKGQITAVGSDLFEENFQYLREGVFTQLLYKKPYLQAYLAAKYLLEYIMQNSVPPRDTIYVNSEVVFQSSMAMYEEETYKLLL